MNDDSDPSKVLGNATSPTSESLRSASSIAVFSGLLLVSFFLPWVRIWGVDLSGFRIQEAAGDAKLVWIVPILAGIALIALGAKSKSIKGAALFAGLSPFLALGYGFHKVGDNLMQIVSFGGYAAIFSGVMLIVLAARMK